MSRKLVIPVFVPHEGCPVRCSFCDQRELTGTGSGNHSADINHALDVYLSGGWQRNGSAVELAFYGGSFTLLSPARQESLLAAACEVRAQGLIDEIRISTRPDGIDNTRLDLLERFGVTTVELGVQSMDDAVLSRNNRGHTAEQSREGIALLKARGFRTGVQIMPGLPGETPKSFLKGIRELVSLKPDMARIYPAVVLRGTELERWYQDGSYSPLALEEAVDLCVEALLMFRRACIPVARIGLQSTPELAEAFIAGPYHPAFRQMVDSSIALRMMELAWSSPGAPDTPDMPFLVHSRYLSTALGQKKGNLFRFKMRYNHAPRLAVDDTVPYEAVRRGDIVVTLASLQAGTLASLNF